jgi:TonB family protein
MTPLASSILAAALAALAPATAAGPFPSEWVGQWELDPDGPDKCALKRSYADGTRLESTGWPGGIHVLDIRNPGWPEPVGGPYRLVSLSGGERLELDRSDSAPNGLRLLSRGDLGARIAASDAIEVIRPDGTVLARIDLAGIAAATARLPGCLERTAKLPWIVAPPPQILPPAAELERLGTPARAKVALHTLITDLDYPWAAVRAEEQGTVAFQILVGTDGRITDCRITASSGSESLDSTTCRILAERAVFEPARDHRGTPVADRVKGRIVWSIAEPEPLPRLPR